MALKDLFTLQSVWAVQGLTTNATRFLPIVFVVIYGYFSYTSKCIGDGSFSIFKFGTCKVPCPEGSADAGLCWSKCGQGSINTGAFCQEKCRDGYEDVAGVCWKRCAKTDKDTGAFCQQGCREGYREDSPGICYKQCREGDVKVGCCLCRERCPDGWKDVAGVCWRKGISKVMKTYAKDTYVPEPRPKDTYTAKTTAKKAETPVDTVPLIKSLTAFFAFLGIYIMYRIGWAILGKIFFPQK